jgi:hypothetical protein
MESDCCDVESTDDMMMISFPELARRAYFNSFELFLLVGDEPLAMFLFFEQTVVVFIN